MDPLKLFYIVINVIQVVAIAAACYGYSIDKKNK